MTIYLRVYGMSVLFNGKQINLQGGADVKGNDDKLTPHPEEISNCSSFKQKRD